MNEIAKNATAGSGVQAILLSELEDGVLTLRLNNPDKRNPLSEALIASLQAAFDRAAENADVRVIVLASTGPVFCSGHDLKEMTAGRQAEDGGRAYFGELMQRCSNLMQTIVNHPNAVIADIRGTATAAGCQLAASCDLAVAQDDVRFATPGVNLGLFCSTPMVALSRKVSRNHAMEMLLTGDLIGADRAAEFGLVNKVCEPGEMDEAVYGWARKIASKSTLVVKTGKQAFYKQAEMPLDQAYAYTAEIMADNMMKRDAEEGIGAFLEKRKPHWRDE